jgi:hypothetical protein
MGLPFEVGAGTLLRAEGGARLGGSLANAAGLQWRDHAAPGRFAMSDVQPKVETLWSLARARVLG